MPNPWSCGCPIVHYASVPKCEGCGMKRPGNGDAYPPADDDGIPVTVKRVDPVYCECEKSIAKAYHVTEEGDRIHDLCGKLIPNFKHDFEGGINPILIGSDERTVADDVLDAKAEDAYIREKQENVFQLFGHLANAMNELERATRKRERP